MTMHEQELTLFGGWAKVQTPPPIEIGVAKCRDTPSVLVSLRDHDDCYMGDDGYHEPVEWRIESVGAANYKPHIQVKVEYEAPAPKVYQVSFDRTFQRENWDIFPIHVPISPGSQRGLLVERWLNMAFLRYFELWKKGTPEKFRNALLGTDRLLRSFSGKTGANNNMHDPHKKGTLDKQPDGQWHLIVDVSQMYPRIPHLPPEGVQSARAHAYKLREKRLAQPRIERGA